MTFVLNFAHLAFSLSRKLGCGSYRFKIEVQSQQPLPRLRSVAEKTREGLQNGVD